MTLCLLKGFKMPHIDPYSGQIDHKFYVERYRKIMYIQGLIQDEMCRPFFLTLEGQARIWYQKLKH